MLQHRQLTLSHAVPLWKTPVDLVPNASQFCPTCPGCPGVFKLSRQARTGGMDPQVGPLNGASYRFRIETVKRGLSRCLLTADSQGSGCQRSTDDITPVPSIMPYVC